MAESWLAKRKVRKRWWTIDQMYSEMQQTRNQGDPQTSALSKLRVSIAPSVVWTTLTVLVGVFMYWRSMGTVLCDPILKGPPQFILLAIIVALSAYLRAVRSSAVEQRDKIASGKAWNYPLEPPYRAFTERKLELLDGVAKELTVVSPFFIVLFIAITSRTAVDAFDRLDGFGGKISHVLCVVDFVVVVWVFFAFLGLAYSHFVARRRDDRIRAVARDFEDEIIAKSNSEKAQKQKAEDAVIELAHEAIALSMSEETEPHGGETASQKQTARKKYGIGTIAVGLALIAVSLFTNRQDGG